jgi:site-specific DNA-methyltransferase (adenine-specific)
MTLIQGDCIIEMAKLKDNTVDLLFCDLPYGQTNCSWDCLIDLTKFWKEVNRICKETTPMFFTCSTKFGVTLINSNPKNFRYDMVWVKTNACGFLNARKMPMRKHEMVYVFYRKLPFYDISSHKNKFLRAEPTDRDPGNQVYGDLKSLTKTNEEGIQYVHGPGYDPPLPTTILGLPTQAADTAKTVLRETNTKQCYDGAISYNYEDRDGAIYDPPLPNSLLEIRSEKGKHATQKPTALIEWCLKYYSKEGDTVLDPTMGSGSTGVACAKMNRKFIGIEMDAAIFEGAKKRIGV